MSWCGRCQGIVFGVMLVLWCVGAGSAWADIRQARDPIFNHHIQALLEDVQASGTDLPMSLQTGRDVYLFITAGAAYTEVEALAPPSVPPSRLAQALAGATAGTRLSSRTVTWSSDDYSAARLFARSGPLPRMRSVNRVPVGALIAGLRHAGFRPHCLLRIPIYAAAAGLPPPCRPLTHYAWYDQAQVAPLGQVTVRAALSGADVASALFFFLCTGLCGTVGLLIATRVARNEQVPVETRRRRCRAWGLYPTLGCFLLLNPLLIFYLRTPRPLALADLWFGSGASSTVLLPILMLPALTMAVFLVAVTRRERKLLGVAVTPVQIAMSPEEKAVHQRMTRWTLAPHLFGVALVFGTLFLLPHNSPYYQAAHPLSYLIAGFGTMIVSRFFRKPMSAFTRVSVDDDLTWRARQIGSQMGVRLQDVRVVDSTAASVAVSILSERGGHLKVTRKLVEVMSPEEMDFLLAHQAALIQARRGGGATGLILLTLLPSIIPVALMVWLLNGHSPLVAFNLMPYIMVAIFLGLLAPFFIAQKVLPKAEARRAMEADRRALEVTGDTGAAQSALAKMMQHFSSPIPGTATPLVLLGQRLKALQTQEGVPLPTRSPV